MLWQRSLALTVLAILVPSWCLWDGIKVTGSFQTLPQWYLATVGFWTAVSLIIFGLLTTLQNLWPDWRWPLLWVGVTTACLALYVPPKLLAPEELTVTSGIWGLLWALKFPLGMAAVLTTTAYINAKLRE